MRSERGKPLGTKPKRATAKKQPEGATLTLGASLVDGSGALLTEVRLFTPGVNETDNGDYVFSDRSENAVMSKWGKQAHRGMIDLEHLSLDKEARHYDPDARASYKLEMRAGELWATDIKYTPDGRDRVLTGKQGYLSPAFLFDPDTKEILEIHNIALVAIPATHAPQALCAASKQLRRATMAADGKGGAEGAEGSGSGGGLEAIAKVLGLGEDASLTDLLSKIGELKAALGGDDDGDEPDADDVEEMSAAGAPPPPPANAPPGDKKTAKAAASKKLGAARKTAHRALLSHTGAKTTVDAVKALESWKAIVGEVAAERAKLAKERETLEANERRELVAKMVTLGKEDPAGAWSDNAATIPAEPWASMKIEQLRARVEKLSAKSAGSAGSSNSVTPNTNVRPPAKAPGIETLSARELELCKQKGIDPAAYAAKFKQPSAAQAGG